MFRIGQEVIVSGFAMHVIASSANPNGQGYVPEGAYVVRGRGGVRIVYEDEMVAA